MAKKTTPHNTGLSIKRNGSKFTASWKLAIKASDVKAQKLRYRTHNGNKWLGWTTKTIGKKATSYSFTLSESSTITNVQVQTQILKSGSYTASDWTSSSATFKLAVPPVPTLTVTNNSANSTTFNWSITTNATNSQWYYRTYYRTRCDESSDSEAGGWGAWTYASNSSYTYTGDQVGKVRMFQVRSKGPAGYSAVRTQKHVIGYAPIATWSDPAVTCVEKSSYYQMTYNINLSGSTYAIDSVVPQYYITTPTSSMTPDGNSWTDGTAHSYYYEKSDYTLAISTNSLIDEDQCLWARVKTTHDSVESYSEAYRVITGKLKKPSLSVSVSTPQSTGFTVSITVTDAKTSVPNAYMQVFLEKYSATGIENYILIGTVANGAASASITCTDDITGETGYAIHVRNVTSDGVSMTSDFYSYAASMVSAPTLNSVVATNVSGKVYLSWTNNWSDATGVIIAWTYDPDNWMSNEDPEEYEIKEIASNWFITGLETGKTWYFRVRSVKTTAEGEILSPWSADKTIDLSSAPAVPKLYLSDETITADGMVTAYWSYVSTDGTGQISGNIVKATYSNGTWTYGASVGATTTAQHIDIYAAEQGWTNGTTVYLALQTGSGSGGLSGYSTPPVQLVIAAKPTVAISSTSLSGNESVTEYFIGDGSNKSFICANTMSSSPTVKVDGATASVSSYTNGTVVLATAPGSGKEVKITYSTSDNNVLKTMPLTATVTTTNSSELTIAIERATSYPMLRPDGTETDGALGETVYVETIQAEASNSISISMDDLIGRLDDGAWYYLVATASDNYGQSAETRTLFKVHWSHQAWMPTATFITDATNYIAKITPVSGTGYSNGDKCDIYRLGADKPELIIQGGAFGTQYVDPYPAFGPDSGYSVVTVTSCNDYITENDEIAEYNTTVLENNPYTQLNPKLLVIDFDGDRVELPYNISLGNSWAKDFQRTTYLGGHVAGDHNKAVTRDLSATTVLVKGGDPETALKMRALARYAGLCHVRTPEGSSFTANVQVSESQSFDSATIDYSLTIQMVDTVGFDGMTNAEWSELQ